jgi:hypothetical protein
LFVKVDSFLSPPAIEALTSLIRTAGTTNLVNDILKRLVFVIIGLLWTLFFFCFCFRIGSKVNEFLSASTKGGGIPATLSSSLSAFFVQCVTLGYPGELFIDQILKYV